MVEADDKRGLGVEHPAVPMLDWFSRRKAAKRSPAKPADWIADQFQEIVNEPESAGRKLEFLTQEIFREANTIGSKASDVDISRHVVEIKSALEKVRELVQNVE